MDALHVSTKGRWRLLLVGAALALGCGDAEVSPVVDPPTDPSGDDACAGETCSGQGECVTRTGGIPVCLCNEGYVASGTDGLECWLADLPTSCDDAACSGRGECLVTPTGVAYCECEEGYLAQGLECVLGEECTPTLSVSGSLELPGRPSALAIDGTRAYVRYGTTSMSQVLVADVSQVTSPAELEDFQVCQGIDAGSGLAIKDGFLFVGCEISFSHPVVEVWDTRTVPTLVATIDRMGGNALVVEGDRLFGMGRGGAFTADVSDPAAPVVGGAISGGPTWPEASATFGNQGMDYCTDISILGNLAYLACGLGVAGGSDNFRGLMAIDISNTNAPAFVGRFFLSGSTFPKLVVAAGGSALTYSNRRPERNGVELDQTLGLLNTAVPGAMSLIQQQTDEWGPETGFFATCTDFDPAGAYGYLACTGRLWAVSTAGPPLSAQAIEGTCHGETGNWGQIQVVGDKLYSAGEPQNGAGCSGSNALVIYDHVGCP